MIGQYRTYDWAESRKLMSPYGFAHEPGVHIGNGKKQFLGFKKI
ncbi:MAG: hypothetical protein NTW47_04725 [Proteobacteria bacterium]|nr:hypothetical protein [Pseudomonadota bacterium]